MLQLSAAGKRYGHKLLFEGADWMITPRDRVGLVGANGTGKSTLLKILAGSESLDYGSVSRAKGISAGYLPQDGLALSGRTVFAGPFLLRQLDALYFLQFLDPALHLLGLGGLVAKTIDEDFQLLNTLALVKLLLQQPNLLLLDEPTNHLDLEARNWLEEYLSN